MTSTQQTTIKTAVTVAGVGLHTGEEVRMTFNPAPPNHGIKFRRIDLTDKPYINADVDNVIDVSRGTTLQQNGARVSTVEHVMAALAGMEVDNVLIDLDSMETPIMDGSSMVFVEALQGVGVKEQHALREYFTLVNNIT